MFTYLDKYKQNSCIPREIILLISHICRKALNKEQFDPSIYSVSIGRHYFGSEKHQHINTIHHEKDF